MTGRDDAVTRVLQAALGPDKPERDQLLLAFGENLRAHRLQAGFSRQALAERCFVRSGQISQLERGRTAPSLLVVLLLADVMGVGMGELVGGLAAPSRRASREQILALIAQQPGISTDELAQSLGLPPRYVFETARCMASYGEIVWRRSGWQSGLDHPDRS
jgi:transcriptional regulator with XRE-family HTH domain